MKKLAYFITCFVVLHVYILLDEMQHNRQAQPCDVFKQIYLAYLMLIVVGCIQI